MNKRDILVFVFDGFADWEAAYALAGINKSGAFQIKTMAIEKVPTTSMGGVSVFPDLDFMPGADVRDIDLSTTAMLILPGGTAWEDDRNNGVAELVLHCVENQIPVAAICAATVFLARLGLLDHREHTSNDLGYLKALSPEYKGSELYRHQSSVSCDGIISANGTAPVEFAGDIFEILDINGNRRVKEWYSYFQNKMVSC